MKLFNIYNDILLESTSNHCFSEFGKYLFGSFSGKEEDTQLESDIFKQIYDFVSGEQMSKKKDNILITAFDKLKQCTKEYPDILKVHTQHYYRGTLIDVSQINKNELKYNRRKDAYIFNNYIYTPKSKIQSWSTNYNVAEDFALTNAKENDYNRIAGVLSTTDTSEMIFNPQFLNILKHKEFESIRIGGKMKCDVIIYEEDFDKLI